MGRAIFFSSFFQTARWGVCTGIVLYFVEQIVLGIVIDDPSDVSFLVHFLASFSPDYAMERAGITVVALERMERGLSFDTITFEYQSYSILYSFYSNISWTIIFLILGAYLEQIVPREFGLYKHPCFLCQCKRRLSKEQIQQKIKKFQRQETSAKIEKVSNALKTQELNNEAILISNLTKRFGNKVLAVDDLTLQMYKGQIFSLLGHNGAGKTTTINMLVGMIKPTSGNAYMLGYDISTNMPAIRQKIGICPQHDILFEDLTPLEHLNILGTFKNMSKSEKEKQIKGLIAELDLESFKNRQCKKLSGGEKRRLSVALAFMGNPEVIFLDEPSSGLDTQAKRLLWDTLQKYKQNRIIVLVTHQMDEADTLGDRIAIMGEGHIMTCGSSLFLKIMFGIGYSLNIIKKDAGSHQQVESYIKSLIPSATSITGGLLEITYKLPLDQASKFKELFENLNSKKDQFNIQEYGISVTTLEEVFLKVAAGVKSIKPQIKEHSEKYKDLEEKEQLIKVEDDEEHVAEKELADIKVKSQAKLFCMQYGAMFSKKYHYFKRDKKSLCCELLFPFFMMLLPIYTNKISPQEVFESVVIDENMYANYGIQDVLINDNSLNSQFNQFDFIGTQEISSADIYEFEQSLIDERFVEPVRLAGYYINSIDGENNQYSADIFVNTTAQESPLFFGNILNSVILKYATGNQNAEIKTRIDPFPQTESLEASDITFEIVFYFVIAIVFIPGMISSFMVYEKETEVKHQQIVSGVSLIAYWSGNLTLDYLKYLLFGVGAPILIYYLDVQILIEDGNLEFFWYLNLMLGFTLISCSYLTSFFFTTSGTAQIFLIITTFMSGFIMPLTFFVLQFFETTEAWGIALTQIARYLFPAFCFGDALYKMSFRGIITSIEGETELIDVWDERIAGHDFYFLVFQCCVHWLLIIIFENSRNIRCLTNCFVNKSLIQPKEFLDEDEDIIEARKLAKEANPSDVTIKVERIRKVFQPCCGQIKVAVNDVSLAINEGECFALLGVNGAGKTTTFKMLTGDINPTNGIAYVKGFKIPEQMQMARQLIGYCPQGNVLIDRLTCIEHLDLFSTIKGIPKKYRDQIVKRKIEEMGLHKYKDKIASSLSGGNKRKLQVAIALIGNPPIVFLDEPSSGMDPEARRFMWTIIDRISTLKKQSSIILTTHTMEEAEGLCSRIAIQVEGSLKCIGPVQRLKNKFGQGYQIEIKINAANKETLENLCKRCHLETSIFNHQIFKYFLDTSVEKEQVCGMILGMGGNIDMYNNISAQGYGAQIYLTLQVNKKIDAVILAEYVYLEYSGKLLKQKFTEQFGETKLIEHYSTFFRFKIFQNVELQEIFGYFEDNKEEIGIEQYSIKQSTLEQIFMALAKGADLKSLKAQKNMQDQQEEQQQSNVQKMKQIKQQDIIISQEKEDQTESLKPQKIYIKPQE